MESWAAGAAENKAGARGRLMLTEATDNASRTDNRWHLLSRSVTISLDPARKQPSR